MCQKNSEKELVTQSSTAICPNFRAVQPSADYTMLSMRIVQDKVTDLDFLQEEEAKI